VYDPSKLSVISEEKEVTDSRLTRVWGNSITRLVFIVKGKSLKGEYRLSLRKKA
jgi:hypothetical protein